jgi:3-oxoacyl-[acyl-carrier protein] reductase
MGELDGKVAVITGSGRGIGEAAARKLAANGARIVVSDIDGDVAQKVASEVGGVAHVGDLVTPGACDKLIDAAIESFGQLDIVVNNAGVHRDAPLDEITDEQTRMTAHLPDAARQAVAQLIPLGRGATPEEAADGIYYLCSPGSNYVHGQVLAVSGGITFGMAS